MRVTPFLRTFIGNGYSNGQQYVPLEGRQYSKGCEQLLTRRWFDPNLLLSG